MAPNTKETDTVEVPEGTVVTPDPSGVSDRVLVGTFASPSPSDAAHDALKGSYPSPEEDTEATAVARAAAFDLGVSEQVEESGPRQPDEAESDARSAHLDDVRNERESRATFLPADTSGDGPGGFAFDEDAVQSPEEATAEEEKRREGFSETELEEAEARDAIVRSGDPDTDAGVPNVGTESDTSQEPEDSDKSKDKDKS